MAEETESEQEEQKEEGQGLKHEMEGMGEAALPNASRWVQAEKLAAERATETEEGIGFDPNFLSFSGTQGSGTSYKSTRKGQTTDRGDMRDVINELDVVHGEIQETNKILQNAVGPVLASMYQESVTTNKILTELLGLGGSGGSVAASSGGGQGGSGGGGLGDILKNGIEGGIIGKMLGIGGKTGAVLGSIEGAGGLEALMGGLGLGVLGKTVLGSIFSGAGLLSGAAAGSMNYGEASGNDAVKKKLEASHPDWSDDNMKDWARRALAAGGQDPDDKLNSVTETLKDIANNLADLNKQEADPNITPEKKRSLDDQIASLTTQQVELQKQKDLLSVHDNTIQPAGVPHGLVQPNFTGSAVQGGPYGLDPHPLKPDEVIRRATHGYGPEHDHPAFGGQAPQHIGGGHGGTLPSNIPQEETKPQIVHGSGPTGKRGAEAYLGKPITDQEYNDLVKATSAEAGGKGNPEEEAMIMGSILNRARNNKGGIEGALHAPNQFESVTGSSRNNHQPSANFVRGPDEHRRMGIEDAATLLPRVPTNQTDFTASSAAAYGPGDNINYLREMEAHGGKKYGGSTFRTSLLPDDGTKNDVPEPTESSPTVGASGSDRNIEKLSAPQVEINRMLRGGTPNVGPFGKSRDTGAYGPSYAANPMDDETYNNRGDEGIIARAHDMKGRHHISIDPRIANEMDKARQSRYHKEDEEDARQSRYHKEDEEDARQSRYHKEDEEDAKSLAQASYDKVNRLKAANPNYDESVRDVGIQAHYNDITTRKPDFLQNNRYKNLFSNLTKTSNEHTMHTGKTSVHNQHITNHHMDQSNKEKIEDKKVIGATKPPSTYLSELFAPTVSKTQMA